MPFIVTPGQLSRRAEFYQPTRAVYYGRRIGLPAAMDQLRSSPLKLVPMSRPLETHVRNSLKGYTLHRVSPTPPAPGCQPSTSALLNAGEQSGRLMHCCSLAWRISYENPGPGWPAKSSANLLVPGVPAPFRGVYPAVSAQFFANRELGV